MRRTILFLLPLLAVIIVIWAEGGLTIADDKESSSKSGKEDQIARILLDKEIWGKDFPKAVSCLPGWERIGEKAVAVFPQKVVGTAVFKGKKGEDEAKKEASTLSEALKAKNAVTSPFGDWMGAAVDPDNRPSAYQANALPFFPDDDSIRVAWAPRAGEDVPEQFLAKKLTVDQVVKQIGRPDAVETKRVENASGEGRPTILKLHKYAGGAITFVESNYSPRRGQIDRVLLDVPAVTHVVFKK